MKKLEKLIILHAPNVADASDLRGGNMDAEMFRELQRDLGLDAADLADELGVSIRTIERYRSGKHNIPERVSSRLAQIHAYYFGRPDHDSEDV